MINKDSIVTAYDEHLTLVEWLQKVETALNNAVLTNLGIAKLSDQGNIATYQVTATFADNTTIVSDTFTLPSTDIVTAFSNLTTLVNGFDTRITTNTNNVARALLMPSSAPSTRKVVTINTNGVQDNVDPTELTTLMSNIVDSHGNKRFVEGDINLMPEFSNLGITKLYGKWSLSGTHLMIVLAINIPANTTIPDNKDICTITFPNYITNKLKGLWGSTLDIKSFTVRNATAWYLNIASLKDVSARLYGNIIKIGTSQALTIEAQSACRIQFDLIIDSN